MTERRRLRLYVAGQFTGSASIAGNIRHALAVADAVTERGHIPYLPQLELFGGALSEHGADQWAAIDRAWLLECDAVLVIPGPSLIVRDMMQLAMDNDIPIWLANPQQLGDIKWDSIEGITDSAASQCRHRERKARGG